MKIEVNQDVCIGCGLCTSLCGECFSLDDEKGKAKVIKEQDCQSCSLDEVSSSCPVGAITIEK